MLSTTLTSFFSFDLLLSPLYSVVTYVHIIFGTVLDGNLLKDRVPPQYASWHSFVICNMQPRASTENMLME